MGRYEDLRNNCRRRRALCERISNAIGILLLIILFLLFIIIVSEPTEYDGDEDIMMQEEVSCELDATYAEKHL